MSQLRILCAVLCVGHAFAIANEDLYPFGQRGQDTLLSNGDDVSSEEIFLRSQTPIAFYDDLYDSLYVNSNGLLSFDTELPAYRGNLILPFGYPVIAPFLADVDTSLTGDVFYRETQDPSLLNKAALSIRENFASAASFSPRSLFIVTWSDVGYYKEQYDRVNTFQVVLATDGSQSYAFFHYPEHGLQWLQGAGKSPQSPDVPGQAGFDAGDQRRSFLLPRSGNPEVGNLARESNVNNPGVWMFQIGDTKGQNIGAPDVPSGAAGPGVGSCAAAGGSTCHPKAECVDYSSGFCCQCAGATYGNGINCLDGGVPQRVNGKVQGVVNGYSIDSVDLHSYIVTEDGRTFTAISRIAPEMGFSLQSLYLITDILGWLFAVPQSPIAKNGYMITGGDFNRVATVTFTSGGEQVTITQSAVGKDAVGYMRMTTSIDGTIPALPYDAKLQVQDYTMEFQRNSKGIIKAYSTRAFTVNDVPYRYTVSETITFNECDFNQLEDLPNLRVTVGRAYVVYGETEQIVRYATTNKISRTADGDPCVAQGLRCDAHADCTPSGSYYRCVCQEGYMGGGGVCTDIDECGESRHQCHEHARCYNNEGGHDCRCGPGYVGNGYDCQREDTCGDAVCDWNAECVYDSTRGAYCMCGQGYYGDGQTCQPETPGMCGRYRCDAEARCVRSRVGQEPTCECNPGFVGDGQRCARVDEGDECRSNGDCGRNAECIPDREARRYRCQCVDGWMGDGFTCEQEGCDSAANCDVNARCVFSERLQRYECVCNAGLSGNGYECVEQDCDWSQCDDDAGCAYDAQQGRYRCTCDQGYYGDGYTCHPEEVQCNQVNNCDPNAECLYDGKTGTHRCECGSGFDGDGFACTLKADCGRNPEICDDNARCERRGQAFVCACNAGFRGDGYRCITLQDEGDFLIVMQGQSILQVPLDPAAKGKLVLDIPGQTAVGVDVDCMERYIYWTDVIGKSISKTRMDGSDTQVLIKNLASPEGVAIDYLGRNMYYTDSDLDFIAVADLEGHHHKILHNTDLVNPRAIGVDPQRGYIFWTDWNRDAPKIERSNMDGTDRRTIVREGLGLPNGLFVEPNNQQVCWADAGTRKIECVNYDGGARQNIYSQAQYPFDVTFASENYYWTDWEMQSVPFVNIFSTQPGVPLSLPPGGNGKVYGITAAKGRCPRAQNACTHNNGGCRYLCLPSGPRSRTCVCPDTISEEECNRIGLLL